MEKINFGYSMKNIPIPPRNSYLKALIDKTESFLTRLGWKAIFFLNKKDNKEEKEEETVPNNNYNFKSEKVPPKVKELISFEEDVYKLISNIKFHNYTNDFQKQLNNDVNLIKRSNKVFVPADKTTNMYQLDPEQYNKLLLENVTK